MTLVNEFLKESYMFLMSSQQYFDTDEFYKYPIKVNIDTMSVGFFEGQTKVVSYNIVSGRAQVSDSYLHEDL